MAPLFGSASAQPEQAHLLVEGRWVAKDAGIRIPQIETLQPQERATEDPNVGERVQVVERDLEGLHADHG